MDVSKKKLQIGVDTLPDIPQDTTDRNRTSPLAFTGNKFEFRMLGSSQSIASPNVVFNTIVAEELTQFAEVLEKGDDFHETLEKLLHDTFKAHQRILFNGNGYDDAWVEEAKRRGLSNLRDTVDCMPAYIDPKNVALFTKHGILTESEMHARYEIHLENYCKVTAIEANTLQDMVMQHILPGVLQYSDDLASAILHKRQISSVTCRAEEQLLSRLSDMTDQLYTLCEQLKTSVLNAPDVTGGIESARYFREHVVALQNEISLIINELESCTSAKYWPYPTYADILFSV